MNFKPLILCFALSLTACAQPAPTVAPAAVTSSVTAVANLVVQPFAASRVLLNEPEVTAWTKANIHHVTLTLFKSGVTDSLTTLTIAKADLDQAIRLKNLSMLSAYTVKAKAYADADSAVQIDNLDLDAAGCTTSFTTTMNDEVYVGDIKLALRDKTFAGKTDGSTLNVTDGVVVNTTAAPGIDLPNKQVN